MKIHKYTKRVTILMLSVWFAQLQATAQLHDSTRVAKKTETNKTTAIAYGQQQKNAVSASVSTVSGDELIKRTSYGTAESLSGMLPGLFVEEKALEPGSTKLNMFIRGKATFGNASNAPLVYVDGFERDLSELTVEDIENISVLKDAASCALYGSRGANGVILVTTKRGAEQKTKFRFSSQYGLQQPTKLPEFVPSKEFVGLYNQALDNDGMAHLQYTGERIAGYENGDPYFYPNFDWANEMLATSAPLSNLNFSATGGTKNTQFYVNIGYLNHKGIYKGTEKYGDYSTNINLDRYNFRSNLDLIVMKGLSVKMDVSGQISTKNAPNSSTNSIWNAMYKYPTHWFPVEVEPGIPGGTPVYTNSPVGQITELGYDRISSRYIQSSLQANYDFAGKLKGLSAGIRYAYDNSYTITENYSKTFAVKEVLGMTNSGEPVLSPLIGKQSTVLNFSISGESQSRRNSFEAYTEYEKTFGQSTLNAVILYHQDKQYIDQYSPYAFQTVGARLQYGLKNTYFAELTGSMSGTEVFAVRHRLNFYPALSAAWILSNEAFFGSVEGVDYLKLKASAGYTGNSSIGERFTYRQLYVTSGSMIFGKGNTATSWGLAEGTLPNIDLKPERAFKFNAGFSTQLFSAITLEAEYFTEERTNILTTAGNQISTVTGVGLPNINTGRSRVSGIDGSLIYNQQIENLGITTGITFSYFNSEIKEINEQPLPASASYQLQKGTAIGSVLGLQATGFYQSEAEIASDPVKPQFGTVKPGDIRYKDQNGDNKIDDYDRVYLPGLNMANMDIGFQVGLDYKGFDLSAFFNAQLGESIYLGESPLLFWPLTQESSRITRYVADRKPWTAENAAVAGYPRLTTQESPNNYRRSDFWMVNGNKIRLRTLELGYSLKATTAKRLMLTGARFYARGMNLFSLDHLKEIDPASLSGYPMMQSLHLGMDIHF